MKDKNLLKTKSSATVDIFVPKDQENEYCKQHHIERTVLPNGIEIIGVAGQVDDLDQAEIQFRFNYGRHHCPTGNGEVLHLMEHILVDEEFKTFWERYNVNGKAGVGDLDTTIIISGTANIEVKEYGIWKVLPVVRQMFEKFPNKTTLTDAVSKEKAIIERELFEKGQDHGFRRQVFFDQTIWHSNNPYLSYSYSTPEAVRNCNVADVRQMFKNALVPRNLLISHLIEGNPLSAEKIHQQLIDLFTDFPRVDQPANIIDYQALELTNPNFCPGKFYVHDTNLNTQYVDLGLVWLLSSKMNELPHWTFSIFNQILSKKFSAACRLKHRVYSAETQVEKPFFKNIALGAGLRLSCHQEKNLESFGKEVHETLRQVLFSISKKEILSWIENRRLASIAIKTVHSKRLKDVIESRPLQRIIDPDKIDALWEHIQPEHFFHWINHLLSVPPAIIAVGDIK